MKKFKGKFCYSKNEQQYHGEFKTRDDAIHEARALDHDTFFTAECIPYVPFISVDDIFDQLACQASDHAGEAGEEWLSFIPKEEKNELENSLNRVFKKWMKKTNNEPHFYRVENIEQHDFSEDQIP